MGTDTIDIHNYRKRSEQSLARLEKIEISSANKEKILKFYRHCVTEEIGYGKLSRYVQDLTKIALWLNKDFEKCNREDIENLIIGLDKHDYSEWTKHGFKVLVRKFFKWLRGTEDVPPEVRWIKLRQKNCNKKLPEEILTEEDIKRIIECAETRRDKALIAMLYESGCRIAEILTIRVKHVDFDDFGARITVFGKTGSRKIRVIFSVSYLQSWLNEHPDKENHEAFVWIKGKTKDELIGYDRIRILLARIARKANIQKKVNPHSFRHARASFLANHLTESQLKEVLGWTQSSKMASVYVHLSGRNTDEAILKVYGKEINTKNRKESQLNSKECLRCKTSNEVINKFCKLCGMPLDKQEEVIKNELEKKDLNSAMDVLLKDKEFLQMLTNKIASLQKPI